jgi:hypothetical protein
MRGQPCLVGELADRPGCDVTVVELGQPTRTLAPCEFTGEDEPCWRFVDDLVACPDARRLDVVGVEPSADVRIEAECRARVPEVDADART